jgi:hypothetical protein
LDLKEVVAEFNNGDLLPRLREEHARGRVRKAIVGQGLIMTLQTLAKDIRLLYKIHDPLTSVLGKMTRKDGDTVRRKICDFFARGADRCGEPPTKKAKRDNAQSNQTAAKTSQKKLEQVLVADNTAIKSSQKKRLRSNSALIFGGRCYQQIFCHLIHSNYGKYKISEAELENLVKRKSERSVETNQRKTRDPDNDKETSKHGVGLFKIQTLASRLLQRQIVDIFLLGGPSYDTAELFHSNAHSQGEPVSVPLMPFNCAGSYTTTAPRSPVSERDQTLFAGVETSPPGTSSSPSYDAFKYDTAEFNCKRSYSTTASLLSVSEWNDSLLNSIERTIEQIRDWDGLGTISPSVYSVYNEGDDPLSSKQNVRCRKYDEPALYCQGNRPGRQLSAAVCFQCLEYEKIFCMVPANHESIEAFVNSQILIDPNSTFWYWGREHAFKMAATLEQIYLAVDHQSARTIFVTASSLGSSDYVN